MNYEIPESCQVKGLNEILLKYFGYKTEGVFVEGGAYDGITHSNTWGLAVAGWQGLYIEPLPDFVRQCTNNHRNHPKVKTIQLAMGNYTGTVIMHLAYGNSSYDPEFYNAPHLKDEFNVGKLVSPIDTLDNILTQNNIPYNFDVLVIDTEYSEVKVLQGFTLSKWMPKMVIIEACEQYPLPVLRTHYPFINKFFESYHKVYCDSVNNIYVQSELDQ